MSDLCGLQTHGSCLCIVSATQLKIFDVVITFLNHMKNLIVMQKLESRTVGLKPT